MDYVVWHSRFRSWRGCELLWGGNLKIARSIIGCSSSKDDFEGAMFIDTLQWDFKKCAMAVKSFFVDVFNNSPKQVELVTRAPARYVPWKPFVRLCVCLYHTPTCPCPLEGAREGAEASSRCGYHCHPNIWVYKDYLGAFINIHPIRTPNFN